MAQFPILDREAARSFLQYLDPDAEQFTFQTFTDSEQRKSTYQKRPETGQPIDPLARVLHGTLTSTGRRWSTRPAKAPVYLLS